MAPGPDQLSSLCARRCVTPLGASSRTVATPDTRPSFAEWLDGVRTEALARGHPPGDRRRGLERHRRSRCRSSSSAIAPRPRPCCRSRPTSATPRHAETVFDADARCLRAQPRDARRGRRAATACRPASSPAIWGIESNFGSFSGVRPTITALATLAWDPRRADVLPERAVRRARDSQPRRHRARRLRGSWAGAMGQPQFMPVELSEVRRGLRRRWPPRHLVVARRRLRVDCQLPEGPRLDDRAARGAAR